jgi:hypothetical protein
MNWNKWIRLLLPMCFSLGMAFGLAAQAAGSTGENTGSVTPRLVVFEGFMRDG